MSRWTVAYDSTLPIAPTELWRWHQRPGAFERLTPPWEDVEVVHRDPRGIVDGAEVVLRIVQGGLPLRWVARHEVPDPGSGFSDRQIAGPFAYMHHQRHFGPVDGRATRLTEQITAELPLAPFSDLAIPHVRRQFARMLAWRHHVLQDDLEQQMTTPMSPMRIAITGATGMVGSALGPFLSTAGHTVIPVSRRSIPGGIQWDPDSGVLDAAAWEGLDAVIHLAGENIAEGRWTNARKEALRTSRVQPTSLLANMLATLSRPPRTLISASAVGIYGDRGDEELTEESATATDFLGQLARDWESAAEPAAAAGIRVVHPRFGLILTPAGGVLDRLLTPFRLGVGGALGDGRQFMSWISIDDVLGAIYHLLAHDAISGPANVTAPTPVRNEDFTNTLGHILQRPTIIPVPAFALRAVFGEMADALLLASQHAEPAVLSGSGYRFRYPELEGALRHLLGRETAG